MSKYGVISGLYYPVFGLQTGKYGPEKTLYLDTFHAVILSGDSPETKQKLYLSPKMLRKITECESLRILQEKFYDGVSFSKVRSLHCSDYNFTIKRTHHKFLFGIGTKTSCIKKNKMRKKSIVDQRLNKVVAL